MKIRLTSLLLCLAFLSVTVANAQDIIYKRTKEQINAKVLEIGLDAIRYQPADYPEGPIIDIALDEVWKVHFANGSEWLNTPDPYDLNAITEARDKNRAIKFDFFSPLFGKLTFGYETMIKVGMNLEVKGGIIGPSVSTDVTIDNPSGALFSGGIKFLFGSQHLTRGVKRSHALYGSYFKPEIVFSSFDQDYDIHSSSYPYTSRTERVNITSYGIQLVFGKQSIFGNCFTLDWHFGLGYGGQSSRLDQLVSGMEQYEKYEPYCYSHAYGGPGMPLIYTAGLTIGFLVK